jgi:hypothetical protein
MMRINNFASNLTLWKPISYYSRNLCSNNKKILYEPQEFNEWVMSRASKDVFSIAAQKNKTTLLNHFLKIGIDSNINNGHENLLVAASKNGCANNVSTLLSHGAIMNNDNDMGYSPLFYAAASGCLNTVKVLLENGADPNQLNKRLDLTPLENTVRYMQHDFENNRLREDLKAIRTLLLEKTNYRPELLKQSVEIHDWDWVMEIVKKKSISITDADLLKFASLSLDMTRKLLDCGLNPNHEGLLLLHDNIETNYIEANDILRLRAGKASDFSPRMRSS